MSEVCPQCGAALDMGWPGFYGKSCIVPTPHAFELLLDLPENYRGLPNSWWRRICRACFSLALLNNPCRSKACNDDD